MHLGNCRDVAGGFAEATALHESMLFPIPDAVGFEDAVLADPFAVALHAVLRAPPEPGDTALVYGCGSLGLLTVQLLTALFPRVRVLAVDRKERLRPLVAELGARAFFTARGRELVEQIAAHLGAPVRRPFFGLPWIHGGVDRVYDTVGAPGSLEIAVRIVRPRAAIVMVGVAEPARFEWTPLYFKEIALLGSNAYGVEQLEGRRAHGIELFLDLVASGRIAPRGFVTHRYPLERFGEAFMAVYDKRRSGAIKVLFDPALAAPVITAEAPA
jgi:threonine dehydrogenase-like Zn-dependent dehydrogenase